MSRGTRVKPRSDKRVAMDYSTFVQGELAHRPCCQLADLIVLVDPLWTSCRGKASGLHHLRKRSSAGAITCRANTLPSCNPCNGWVENEPDLALLAGLVVREGDHRWPNLGARHHANHHEGTT